MDQKNLLRTLTIGIDSILVPYIDRYLAQGKFPDELTMILQRNKKGDPYFHPSGDCFTPPRNLYLQKKGIETKPTTGAALRKTFDCGHLWHMYLQGVMQEMGFLTQENTEVPLVRQLEGPSGLFTGAGTADCVDVAIPEKGLWLVDIKTMRKDEFESGANKYTYMKWEAQVNCYMDWLGVDNAMILAVCKDSPHLMREYRIVKKPELLEEIYGRWSYTQKCLNEGIIPEEGWIPEDLTLLNPGDSSTDIEVATKAE